MHLASPDGKHTICNHTGEAAKERTSDINSVDCSTCLWGLLQILLVQLTGALKRLHVVERSKTTPVARG
jgi:hypothetical protein